LKIDTCDSRVAALQEEFNATDDPTRLGESKLTAPGAVRALNAAMPPSLQRAMSAPAKQGPGFRRQVSSEAGDAEDLQEEEEEEQDQGDEQAAPPTETGEESEEGSLSLQVWCAYAKTMGPFLSAAVFGSFIAANLMQMGASFWLASWTESAKPAASNSTLVQKRLSTVPLPSEPLMSFYGHVFAGAEFNSVSATVASTSNADTFYNLGIYALLSFLGLLFFTSRMLIFRYASLLASRELHQKALWCMMRSPMSWLDSTPKGRIVNRFSQDMQKLDMELTGVVSGFIDSGINLCISMFVILLFVPAIIFLLVPLAWIYNKVQKKFRTTAREVQRMASKSRSPIFQGLDEALIGVSSIRSFEQERRFAARNMERVALNLKLNFCIMCCNRWLSLRLRSLGTVPVMLVAIGMVIESRMNLGFGMVALNGATAGIVLRYSLQLVDLMQGLLMNLTSTELNLIALERIRGFTQLSAEPALENDADRALASWPSEGCIEFQNVTMRYRPDLPRVLNGISFTIPGGTSVGVVGRTGAGKSSLIQALFRLCPLDGGKVSIDKMDLSTLGLHAIRRRLAIIPQDPVGFTGTLRFNLDPFSERRDADLWQELSKVQMESFFKDKEEGLGFFLSAGGENLSVGQRQLVCVARAFLRGCRVLILDEATASVDFQTDELLQEVLRNEVVTNKLTTLTIAHRINTILGNDNVMVMDKGKLAEFGPTKKLAADPKSRFYTFVHAADEQH
jgi:ABC-type multidrug transport system fused ATPase/permease subunit